VKGTGASGKRLRQGKKGAKKEGERERRDFPGPTLVVLPLVDILEVVDPRVVVVLSREHDVRDIARMGVRNWVAYPVSMVPAF
jgi:hypothetical protein